MTTVTDTLPTPSLPHAPLTSSPTLAELAQSLLHVSERGDANAPPAQITAGAQSLAQGASEQASSNKEIAGNLHEVTAMAQQASQHARHAPQLSKAAEAAQPKHTQRPTQAARQIPVDGDDMSMGFEREDEAIFQSC